jgi:phytanoyl-CoA hydroxylase
MHDVSQVKKGLKADNESSIAKLQDWQADEVLFEYVRHPNIVKYASAIVGPDVKSVHTMLINKQPNVGPTTRHPLHQDLIYFPFRPVNRICCAWTAMVNINRENGGLVVVPGSHRQG